MKHLIEIISLLLLSAAYVRSTNVTVPNQPNQTKAAVEKTAIKEMQIGPQELALLEAIVDKAIEQEELERKVRSSVKNQKSSNIKRFSGSFGNEDHGHDPPAPEYGPPLSYDKKSFNLWSFKKAIMNALLQAIKAITGGVIALSGQLVKIKGHIVAAKGKMLETKGDSITDFGKHLATKALLTPVHVSNYDHNEATSTSYGPPPTGPPAPYPPSSYGPPHPPPPPPIPVHSYGPISSPGHSTGFGPSPPSSFGSQPSGFGGQVETFASQTSGFGGPNFPPPPPSSWGQSAPQTSFGAPPPYSNLYIPPPPPPNSYSPHNVKRDLVAEKKLAAEGFQAGFRVLKSLEVPVGPSDFNGAIQSLRRSSPKRIDRMFYY